MRERICQGCGHPANWHTTGLSTDVCHCGCTNSEFEWTDDIDEQDVDETE